MKHIIGFLIIALVLISGCSKDTVIAKPVSEIKTAEIELDVNVTDKPVIKPVDSCAEISCEGNSSCKDGLCTCDSGFKKCNQDCISTEACCSTDDCAEGELCKDNACVDMNCKYNEIFDTGRQECVCNVGTKYCAAQKKCIPKSNCCMHVECDRYQRCVDTIFRLDICLTGEKKMCRSVMENRPEVFIVNKDRYDIQIKDVLQDEFFSIDVNGIEYKMKESELTKIGSNSTVYIDSFDILGGYCRKDTAD